MAQVVVTDLWVTGVSSLYVTGVNFHVGKTAYSDAYASRKMSDEPGLAPLQREYLAAHNPFENWGFMRFMQWSGFLEGDSEFLEILNLTPSEFAGRLQISFGFA